MAVVAGELERRRALGYPPFSHLIRVVCAAEESSRAREAATAVGAGILECLERIRCEAPAAPGSGAGPLEGAGPVVLGPAALFRLRGRERQVLLIKAARRREAVRAVGEAVQQVADARSRAGVSFSVDVDPQ